MEPLTDKHIKDFLERAPLYSWWEFVRPKINRGSLWIKEIDAFCDTCNQNRPFQDMRSRGGGAGMPAPALATGTSYFEFKCASCCKEKHEYLVEQIVGEDKISIQKWGELPRKKLDRDPLLKQFFSNDGECYEKAVVCLANGYGIAAFAYMRRIVENNIDSLIELIKSDVSDTDKDSPTLSNLAALKKESPMSDKIKIANSALPNYLIPSGLNPLGRLYQVLSEGVHSLSDAECLKRADTIQACIKYLIGELASRKKNRDSFSSLVSSL